MFQSTRTKAPTHLDKVALQTRKKVDETNSKTRRSYLEKGPTREQRNRRNFLKEKLFEDADDEEPIHGWEQAAAAAAATTTTTTTTTTEEGGSGHLVLADEDDDSDSRQKARKNRFSRSLSPTSLKIRVLGKSRSSKSPTSERKSRRSKSPNAEMKNNNLRRRHRAKSENRIDHRLETGQSSSPRRMLKGMSGKSRSNSGLKEMRKSLLSDKKQLDTLEGKFKDLEMEATEGDEETVLERAVRRVALRRRQIQRTKTEGDQLEAMELALKRRREMEQEKDEGIGGIWAMGLRALERVYDDIS